MAITQVLSDDSGYGSPTTVFSSAPSEGDLIVIPTSHRSAGQDASLTDFTKIFERDVLPSNSTYRRALAVFAKVAGASESNSYSPSWSSGASHAVGGAVFNAGTGREWDAVSGAVSASNDNGATSDATSLTTGTTASTSGQLVIAIGCWKNNFGTFSLTVSATGFALSTYGNEFPDSFEVALGMVWDEVTGTATRSASLTIDMSSDDTNTGLTAGICVFSHSASGGGGGSTPKGPLGHPMHGPMGGPVYNWARKRDSGLLVPGYAV